MYKLQMAFRSQETLQVHNLKQIHENLLYKTTTLTTVSKCYPSLPDFDIHLFFFVALLRATFSFKQQKLVLVSSMSGWYFATYHKSFACSAHIFSVLLALTVLWLRAAKRH